MTDTVFLWRRILSLEQLGLALDDDTGLGALIHRQAELNEATQPAPAPAETPDET